MGYSCEQLSKSISDIRDLNDKFKPLYHRFDVKNLLKLREEIDAFCEPILSELIFEGMECVDSAEMKMRTSGGELGIAIREDGTVFVHNKEISSIAFRNLKMFGDVTVVGQKASVGWQGRYFGHHTYNTVLDAPMIPRSDGSLSMIFRIDGKKFLRTYRSSKQVMGLERFDLCDADYPLDDSLCVFVADPTAQSTIIAGNDEGGITRLIFDSNQYAEAEPFLGNDEMDSKVKKIEFLADHRFFVTMHEDKRMYLWDSVQQGLVRRLPIFAGKFTVNPANNQEIFYYSGKGIFAYDLFTGKSRPMDPRITVTASLACDKSGKYLFSGLMTVGGVDVLDARSGKYLKKIDGGAIGTVEKIIVADTGEITTASEFGYSVFRKKAKSS
jgi:hypothetical protein